MPSNNPTSIIFLYVLTLLLVTLGFPFSSYSQPHVNAGLGKGLQITAADSSFSLKFSPRFQVQYEGNLNTSNNDWKEKLIIRRARFKFEGFAYSPSLEYKLELAVSNRDVGRGQAQNNYAGNILLEALIKWHFHKNFALWAGQTKLPGNRGNVTSSQKLQFVDRSLMNAYFNLDRDIGIQLRHQFAIQKAVFKQIAAVSIGEGKNVTANNSGGRDYTFRIEALPFGEFGGGNDYAGADLARTIRPKLAIGVTYDLNKGASREGGQTGNFMDLNKDLHTIFIDGILKYKGSSLMMEYAFKTTPDDDAVIIDEHGKVLQSYNTGKGINLQGGYLFKNNYEIAGRYSQVSPAVETQKNRREEFTLALSKYISGHNIKVQSDFSLVQEATKDNHLRFRLQLEIGL